MREVAPVSDEGVLVMVFEGDASDRCSSVISPVAYVSWALSRDDADKQQP